MQETAQDKIEVMVTSNIYTVRIAQVINGFSWQNHDLYIVKVVYTNMDKQSRQKVQKKQCAMRIQQCS